MKKILLSVFVFSILLPTLAFASFDTNLSFGIKGNSVRELQTFLISQKLYSGGITGTYDNLTKKAVSAFQNKYKIKPASGIFNLLTRIQAKKLAVTNTTKITASKFCSNGMLLSNNCAATPATATYPVGCTSAIGFSKTNGSLCSGVSTAITNITVSTVTGCTSTVGNSSTTGLSCSGDGSCVSGSFFNKSTGSCINFLTYCQNQNGSNATYDSVKNSCSCATGYTLNSNNICAVPETGYQVCSDMNATWDGTSYTSNGGFSCACKTGYTSSSAGKSCVVAPIKTGYQVCSGMNATWDGTYGSNGKYNCVCQTGYIWNSAGTSCQIQPTDNSAQIYQTQYQVVQAKIKPLQDQATSLQAICPNLTLALGEEGIKCTLAASQAVDVYGYINAIQGDLLTPVTDVSIIYENKLDDLQQKIFQIKMDYEQQVANINGSGTWTSRANGQIQNAATAANAKINVLNQQIQFTLSAYKNGIAP